MASVAVSNGRVFVVSDSNLYAIGKKDCRSTSGSASGAIEAAPANAVPVAHVQVVPTELILKPGDKVNFRVRLFDEHGVFIREEPAATWSLDQTEGHCCKRSVYCWLRMRSRRRVW